MEFTTKERIKSIKVIVSDEERALIEEKMKMYGYQSLASYIRDAAIYEKVKYVDWKNKKVLLDAYAENTKVLNEILKEFKNFSKYATHISKEDLDKVSHTMFAIYKNQQAMIDLIDEKLDLNVWEKVNR